MSELIVRASNEPTQRSLQERLRDLFRWEPFAEMETLWAGDDPLPFLPNLELRETRDAYVVKADVPGVSRSRLVISVSGGRLSLSGHRDETPDERSSTGLWSDRLRGRFSRSLTLPGPVDAFGMHTMFNDGVLTVTLPKRHDRCPAGT